MTERPTFTEDEVLGLIGEIVNYIDARRRLMLSMSKDSSDAEFRKAYAHKAAALDELLTVMREHLKKSLEGMCH